MAEIGQMFGANGWVGVSGFSDGADTAWLSNIPEEQQEVWLPWWTYNNAREYEDPHGRFHRIQVTGEIHRVAKLYYQGNWEEASNGVHLLMARNVAIIARDTMDTAVNLVAYWQSEAGEKKLYGGTNHGIRVAKAIDVPCFNIRLDSDVEAMGEFASRLTEQRSK